MQTPPLAMRLGFVAAGVGSIWWPGFTTTLLSDDWAHAAFARHLDLGALLGLWSHPHGGWYRPLSTALWWTLTHALGHDVWGFHAVVWCLYVAVAVIVGWLAAALSGDDRIGLAATALFSASAVHAEPVLWLSASNEVLAALFALLGVATYLRFAESGGVWAGAAVVASFALAIGAKETAALLPVWFLSVDRYNRHRQFHLSLQRRFKANRGTLRVPRRQHNQSSWPALVTTFLACGFIAMRFFQGSPYSLSRGVLMLPINTGYNIAVGVLGLPEHYGYSSSLTLLIHEPALPLASTGLTVLGLGTLITTRRRQRRLRRAAPLGVRNLCVLSALWFGATLPTTSLAATGRTLFLASVAVAWLIAALVVDVWTSGRRWAAGAALAMLMAANGLLIHDRIHWWQEAAAMTHRVIEDLVAIGGSGETAAPTRVRTVCVVGLPDHLRHAYVFRNALEPIGTSLHPPIHLVHAPSGDRPVCDSTLAFEAETGGLADAHTRR